MTLPWLPMNTSLHPLKVGVQEAHGVLLPRGSRETYLLGHTAGSPGPENLHPFGTRAFW